MCHAFLSDSRFYQLLLHTDQDIAAEVQTGGCACGDYDHRFGYIEYPDSWHFMDQEDWNWVYRSDGSLVRASDVVKLTSH